MTPWPPFLPVTQTFSTPLRIRYLDPTYESLITLAGAMDKQDVVSLLRENLQQEQHTLEEASGLMSQIAEELTHQTA